MLIYSLKTFSGIEKEEQNPEKTDQQQESKIDKEETAKKVDCSEEPNLDSMDTSKPEESKTVASAPETEDKPKESEQANVNSSDSNTNKNIPENYMLFQNNKEFKDKNNQECKVSKGNRSATNGNDESQCSVDEPSAEAQNCYW